MDGCPDEHQYICLECRLECSAPTGLTPAMTSRAKHFKTRHIFDDYTPEALTPSLALLEHVSAPSFTGPSGVFDVCK
jgi:hypothetical protein